MCITDGKKMETKKCSKCGEVKPVGEFYRNKTSKDGFCRYCKICDLKTSNERHFKNREERLIKQKEYYKKNKEKIDKKHLEWKLKNIEKVRESARKGTKKWRENNPDKIKKDERVRINYTRYNINTCPAELKPIVEALIIVNKLNKKIKNIGESK